MTILILTKEQCRYTKNSFPHLNIDTIYNKGCCWILIIGHRMNNSRSIPSFFFFFWYIYMYIYFLVLQQTAQRKEINTKGTMANTGYWRERNNSQLVYFISFYFYFFFFIIQFCYSIFVGISIWSRLMKCF